MKDIGVWLRPDLFVLAPCANCPHARVEHWGPSTANSIGKDCMVRMNNGPANGFCGCRHYVPLVAPA